MSELIQSIRAIPLKAWLIATPMAIAYMGLLWGMMFWRALGCEAAPVASQAPKRPARIGIDRDGGEYIPEPHHSANDLYLNAGDAEAYMDYLERDRDSWKECAAHMENEIDDLEARVRELEKKLAEGTWHQRSMEEVLQRRESAMSEQDLCRLEQIAHQHDVSTDNMTIALFPRDILVLIAEVRKWRNITQIEANHE